MTPGTTNFKISDKLAQIERLRSASGKEQKKDDLQKQVGGNNTNRAKRKIYVKVINTLDPSHESASAFTRKTKMPRHKVRSAYQSVISFSNQLNAAPDDNSQENNGQVLEFNTVKNNNYGDNTRKLLKVAGGLTNKSKTTRTTSNKK